MSETASDAVRTEYHGARPSEAVVLAVAEARDADPLDLERLNNVIDPDALDRLFQPAGEESSVEELSFTMEGCEVVVHGDGDVVVTPPVTADEGGAPVAVRED